MKEKRKIIGFAGQLNNGKNVAGDYLVKYLNSELFQGKKEFNYNNLKWKGVAFGDSLKDLYCDLFKMKRSDLELYKRQDSSPPNMDLPVRKSLQSIGDILRQSKANIWIEKLFDNHKDSNLVITDARYRNEAKAVKDRGGKMVLVYRPGHENDFEHPSESQYKEFIEKLRDCEDGPITDATIPFDWLLVNAGTIEDVIEKLQSKIVPYFEEYFNGTDKN